MKYSGAYKSGAYGSREGESLSGRALYSSYDGFESDFPAQTGGFKAFWGGADKKPDGKQESGKYAVGTRVRHTKFGVGMVVAVRNGGATINVAFEKQGIKELSAAIAPLEIIKAD